jgi:putative endonuclease
VRRSYYVYIMANVARTLYAGVTNNLERRVWEHKVGDGGYFTSKYKLHRLVYCDETGDVEAAIQREKQIKGWSRERKIALIESMNPTWQDLAEEWFSADDLRHEGR